MEFLKTLISEIFARYGDSVAGFWFDQCGPTADVRDHVKQCNPHASVFVNTGVTGNEEIHPLSDFIVSEYYGSIESCDSDTLPTHYSQVNRQIGKWWASGGKAPTDARNLYRYSVRTIATRGQFNGGIAWSCGPYIDQTWESGVRDLLSRIGDLVRAHEGFYHTVPGVSYPTAPNALLEKTHWGVSTESADGKTVYLHVLNLPADGVLKIGLPEDGKVFSRAFCRDMALPLTRTAAGYTLLLPADCDPVDTVVRLVCD